MAEGTRCDIVDADMAVYDSFARFYDRLFAPFEKRFLGRWRSETLGLLPLDAAILELGAGTGANFKFYPTSKIAISSELAAEMITIAATKRRSNLLVQADAQSLPFAENSFDGAFATLVFCSIPEPNRAFGELLRVVKPGGAVVLLEHVRPDGPLGVFFDVLNVLTVALIDDHFNRRTADTAAAAGLEVLEIRRKAFGIVNLIDCRTPC